MFTLTGLPINQKHYVYALISPISNKPFYIGKGSGTRYQDHFKETITGKTHNKYKTSIIKKILVADKSIIVDIVFVSLSKRECFQQEKLLIEKFGRKNNKTGILSNLTDGGEGGSYPHSEKHKQRLRENNPGGKATSKEVLQICSETGKIIKKWPSTRQAGISLGMKCWRNISHSAKKYKNRVVGGYYWRWPDDPSIKNGYLKEIKLLNQQRTDRTLQPGREIVQYSIDGQKISVWKSMSAAGRHLNCSVSSISKAVQKQKPFLGFLWKRQTTNIVTSQSLT